MKKSKVDHGPNAEDKAALYVIKELNLSAYHLHKVTGAVREDGHLCILSIKDKKKQTFNVAITPPSMPTIANILMNASIDMALKIHDDIPMPRQEDIPLPINVVRSASKPSGVPGLAQIAFQIGAMTLSFALPLSELKRLTQESQLADAATYQMKPN